jgi:hypothetical protein
MRCVERWTERRFIFGLIVTGVLAGAVVKPAFAFDFFGLFRLG